MSLRDLKLPTTEIGTPGGKFTVRGLAFTDLATMATTHGPALALLFGKFTKGQGFQSNEVKSILAELAPQFPEIVSAAIALASDEFNPVGVSIAGKLPLPTQIEALEAIFHNTFASEAELKKFVESVIRMLAGTGNVLAQARLPLSELGFGASGDK